MNKPNFGKGSEVSLPAAYKSLAFVYLEMLEYFMTSTASLKKMNSNRRPIIEPCGAPANKSFSSESQLLNGTTASPENI